MFTRTAKITDALNTRMAVARQLVDAKVVPYAVPAGRKAAMQVRQFAPYAVPAGRKAAMQVRQFAPYAVPAGRKAALQVRQVVGERIVPVVDNALVVSAPARTEALRRGRLAAAALRGSSTVMTKKRRRWPIALVFLGLGGAIGAGAAWLAQAGKPVQLTPYPLTDDSMDDESEHLHEHHTLNGSAPLDLTDESHAHH
jgi:hypothetical protein